jgi:hypothetical protein
VQPILVMPGMTMLHARAGHGKTRLALSLAYATATGAALMDWTVEAPAPVLYVDAELSPQNMQAWLKRLGRSRRNLHILSDKMNYYDGKPRVSLATEADRAYLSRAIARLEPQLIVLDSLFTLVPPAIIQGAVHEDAWSQVIDWMRDLKREGRHILLLHHDSKEGGQYGASIKEIEFDLMLQLRVRSDYSGAGKWAFELSFTKPRHLSAEDAKPRIITATDDGIIEWQRTDLPLQKPRERDAEAQQLRDQVMELSEQGLSVREIAEQVGRSERWVKKVRSEERGADDADGVALV